MNALSGAYCITSSEFKFNFLFIQRCTENSFLQQDCKMNAYCSHMTNMLTVAVRFVLLHLFNFKFNYIKNIIIRLFK